LADVGDVIDPAEDRFFLIRLDPRSAVRALGRAEQPVDPPWFYVG
jgi:CRISPR-associated protein Cas2